MTSHNHDQSAGGRQTVYHDSSLSAFATGLFIGTLATLILATEDGRKAGKKLLSALKDASQGLEPEFDKLKPQLTQAVNNIRQTVTENLNQPFSPLDHLHRTTPPASTPSGPTFTRSGQPLK